jgi:hypothetical protein
MADLEGRKVRDAGAKERFKEMEASIIKTEAGPLYKYSYGTFPPARSSRRASSHQQPRDSSRWCFAPPPAPSPGGRSEELYEADE